MRNPGFSGGFLFFMNVVVVAAVAAAIVVILTTDSSVSAILVHTEQTTIHIVNKRSYDSNNKEIMIAGNVVSHSGRGAVFATENFTTVVAQIGGTARLPCVVRKFSNGVVSWIRRDTSPPRILSIGIGRHIADGRFLVEHGRHLQNWDLIIMHIQPQDGGLYECQVSTHPTTSIFIELRVTEAVAEITGSPDLHIRAGSKLRLVCWIKHSTEPPLYVFWYHNHKMINHEPGIFVRNENSLSTFQLEEAEISHSGNYTCDPSNALSAHINVHVLNATEEENPAAMLHASSSGISGTLFCGSLLIVILNFFLYII